MVGKVLIVVDETNRIRVEHNCASPAELLLVLERTKQDLVLQMSRPRPLIETPTAEQRSILHPIAADSRRG